MSNLKVVDIVKKFRGDVGEDIELWLDRLNVAVRMTSKSTATDAEIEKEMAKVMPLFLEGRAYRTWKRIPDTERTDFKCVKAALLRSFGKTKVAAWEELKTLRYFPGESVDMLVDDAKSLLEVIVGGSPPEELVSLFVLDAMPREISDQVRLHHGEQLNLEKVSSCAKSLTVVPGKGIVAGVNSSRTGGSQSPMRQRTIRCYKCGLLGHVARNCQTVCPQCGQHGHVRRDCERVKPISSEYPGRKASGNAAVRRSVSPDRAVLTEQISSGECSSTAAVEES